MLPMLGQPGQNPAVALLAAADQLARELEHKGMAPATAKRVALERVQNLPSSPARADSRGGAAEGRGILSELGEAEASAVEAVSPFSQAGAAATKLLGKPRTSAQLGKTAASAEKPIEGAVQSAGAAVSNTIAQGIGQLIDAYGVRLAEIIGGGLLVGFALVTLVRGGRAPSLPKAIPVPV